MHDRGWFKLHTSHMYKFQTKSIEWVISFKWILKMPQRASFESNLDDYNHSKIKLILNEESHIIRLMEFMHCVEWVYRLVEVDSRINHGVEYRSVLKSGILINSRQRKRLKRWRRYGNWNWYEEIRSIYKNINVITYITMLSGPMASFPLPNLKY